MGSTKKQPYAHVAIHWEKDKMLDSIAHFCGLSKMQLIEMFVKSAHKSLAYNFKLLGIESLKMRFNIEVKATIAPIPSVHSIPCDMATPNSEVDKIISEDMRKRGLKDE